MEANQEAPRAQEILVCIDGSEGCLHALRWAVAMAKAFNAHLTLLEVIEEEGPLPTVSERVPVGRNRTEYLANERFDAIAAEHTYGVRWERRVVEGSPPETICRMATALSCDLVVMGSRGHGALARVLVGSVSDYVAHHAPCAVMIVR